MCPMLFDELDDDHRRSVALAGTELEDPCIASVTSVVTLGDVVEDLVRERTVADLGQHQATRVDIALR
jgi:hypothetical protein